MRLRGSFVIIGVLGLAVLAAGGSAVWTSVAHSREIAKARLGATITFDPQRYGPKFAPPPSDAMPALTAAQAYAQWAGGRVTRIPPGETAQLGLFTLPVGPYCGAECSNLIVKNGIAYTTLNELAYGYSWRSTCSGGNPLHPLPSRPCTSWLFIDANTGQMIVAIL